MDIATANNLDNPDGIEIGQQLTLPDVEARQATGGETMETATEPITISGDSYTVQRGDHLWGIAVAAYGDGYQWGKIATANNIETPNWIEVGQVLKLPRN